MQVSSEEAVVSSKIWDGILEDEESSTTGANLENRGCWPLDFLSLHVLLPLRVRLNHPRFFRCLDEALLVLLLVPIISPLLMLLFFIVGYALALSLLLPHNTLVSISCCYLYYFCFSLHFVMCFSWSCCVVAACCFSCMASLSKHDKHAVAFVQACCRACRPR